MTSLYDSDDLEKLLQLQLAARRSFQALPDPRALTSPRLFRQFLASQLVELGFLDYCTSHEMQLVVPQSFSIQESITLVSTVCCRCRHHFLVKSDFRRVRAYNDEHRHHMLVPCSQKSTDHPRIKQSPYDDTVGYARYVCVADDCFFNIEISVVPPRIPPGDLAKFNDKNRISRNLESAREKDPDRYVDFSDLPTLGPEGMLRRYLADALQQQADGQPLRINKRNKRFLVWISNDFDDLLKFLGFYEGVDAATDEPCWYITPPEEERNPTRIGTLRARMEDAQVELDILTSAPTTPAWERLLHAFQGEFANGPVDAGYLTSVTEDDLALLGCLAMYPPEYFSWAAILLARLRPRDREKYLDAGVRCIRDRSDDASTEIIMYKSRFDEASALDIRVQEAFAFFDASPQDGLTSDWFLAKYYEMTKFNGTDESKAQAQQHLEAIGNYLGRDIVSEIDPRAAENVGPGGLMTSSPIGSGNRMSISAAANLLGVEAHYTAEIIRGFVERLDEDIDRLKVVEALDVLSELKRQQGKPEEAGELQQIAGFVKQTGYAPALVSQPHSSPKPAGSVDTPPGLKNIGNTCYLNSLLQYFYNVKIVRDLVLNFDLVKLDLDEETVKQRRTGGNGTSVNLEEAIVARQFVEMLQGLFTDLQTTTETAAQPSQKLANTALSSARDILDQQSQNVPPPLPARPSPAPPVPPKTNPEVADEMTESTVNVTVESVNDKLEMASSQSSQTLVDDGGDAAMSYIQLETPDDNDSVVLPPQDDVKMQDSAKSWTLDDKMAEVSRRLEHSDRSGTAQQDVGEIIGNILEHLMRAIRPDGPMPEKPELQADKITKTFFTTIVNCTIKTRKGSSADPPVPYSEESPINVEIVPERWITAYPEEANEASDGASNNPGGASIVRCTLVAALDRYFAYEPIDDGNRARYSSIRALPPIVHICIQRSTPKGKNKNPVIIPEVLYLDRYMEAEKGSPVWLARKRSWALKERLKELEAKASPGTQEAPVPSMDSTEFNNADTEDLATMAASALDSASEEANIQQAFLEDTGLQRKRKLPESLEYALSKKIVTPDSAISYPLSDKFGDISWETSKPLDEMTRQELFELREKEETTFDAMRKEKYSIHAVICHRGGTTAGHYWVWIRDFKRNAWYRYNDETVTEDSRGTEAVLNDLNETGDPYYVAYVRDEIKDDLVEVPQRYKPEANGSSTVNQEVEMIEGVAFDPTQVPSTNGVPSGSDNR